VTLTRGLLTLKNRYGVEKKENEKN